MVVAALVAALGGFALQARGAESEADAPAPTAPLTAENPEPLAKSATLEKKATPAEPVPAKVRRYAERLVRRRDRNSDGKLQPQEWTSLFGKPEEVRLSPDKVLTVDEVAQMLVQYGQNRRIRLANPVAGLAAEETSPSKPGPTTGEPQAVAKPGASAVTESGVKSKETKFHTPVKRLPSGLPAWFGERDLDGDGQLTLSEFAPKPTSADLEEFAKYDLNGDGLVTPKEYLRANQTKPAAKKKAASSP